MSNALDRDLEAARQQRNPIERARALRNLQGTLQRAQEQMVVLRDQTIEELAAGGMPNTGIADLLGVTRARVTQLRNEAKSRSRAAT